jgi:hypothetical protein
MKVAEQIVVDGDGDVYEGGRLHDLALGMEIEDSMSIRGFPGVEGYQGTPETDWDMKIAWPSWINDIRNTCKGRCFLFGSGPSLIQQLPILDRMRNETTFTVNRIGKWKNLPFTPSYHCIAEPGPTGAWGSIIWPQYDHDVTVGKIACNWWPVTAKGWMWCPKAPDDIQMRWEGWFGTGDILPPLPTGWASPLTISQIAGWMGFTEFYFLGIDTTQLGQAWDAEKGRTTEPRNIRSILECFERAGRDIKRAGRTVYDCTPGGLINQEGALEFLPLEEVLDGI